jgi:hypothetical protein
VGLGPVTARQRARECDPWRVLAAVCFLAVIVWVTDQTLGDVRELWRAHRRRRRSGLG